MEFLETAIVVVHLLASLALVGLVLLQQGKGAEAGASFGAGASQTVFGSQGSGNFLTRSTSWLAVVFFITSISLAVVAKQKAEVAVGDELILVPQEAAESPASEAGAGEPVAQDATVSDASQASGEAPAAVLSESAAAIDSAAPAADEAAPLVEPSKSPAKLELE